MVEIHGRCKLDDWGQLRCGLKPAVADIFHLAGLTEMLAVFADEVTAFTTPWPPWARPRALPVSILSSLPGASHQPTPDDAVETPARSRRKRRRRGGGDHHRAGGAAGHRGGQPQGERRPGPPRLVRDRPGRKLPASLRSPLISRMHAIIERRGDAVVIRDLGTTNGTAVNDRWLRAPSCRWCTATRSRSAHWSSR